MASQLGKGGTLPIFVSCMINSCLSSLSFTTPPPLYLPPPLSFSFVGFWSKWIICMGKMSNKTKHRNPCLIVLSCIQDQDVSQRCLCCWALFFRKPLIRLMVKELMVTSPSLSGGGSSSFLANEIGSSARSKMSEAIVSSVPKEQMRTLSRCDANPTRSEGH